MTLKFARNFCLIFFATITVNSFGIEPRFGCHNFSSVYKIADMKSGNNELLRNLKQCMRDTRTYNEENLETAKKLQNDFEAVGKKSWYEILMLSGGIAFAGIFLISCFLPTNKELRSGSGATATGLLGLCKLEKTEREERKEAVVLDIKNFVYTLQKKNK